MNPRLFLAGAALVAALSAGPPARAATACGDAPLDDGGPLPRLERCELIADDALQPRGLKPGRGPNVAIDNLWGSHQLRIVTDGRDVVHALYLRAVDGRLQWRLLRRTPRGDWREEAAGWTTDDVNLLRDAASDRVHVLSWVDSVPSVSDAPDFVARPLPGEWQAMDLATRHYGAAGIGADGTACLKVSVERQTPPRTSDTDLRYLCGRYDAPAAAWRWTAQRTRTIGARHAYDYLFPAAGGRRFLSVAQRDQHKDAAGVPDAREPWVFNGVRLFAGDAGADDWTQRDLAEPVAAPGADAQAPATRQLDTLVDGRGRVLTAYQVIDPQRRTARGLYLAVADARGRLLWRDRLTALPDYGRLRLFEDAAARLWLLWTNKGTLKTQMVLYPLDETRAENAGDGRPSFAVGRGTDLGAAFQPYAIDGSPFLAVPRGGTARRNAIDGLLFTCAVPYDGTPYDVSRCNGADGRSPQRAIHFRIRLPG